MCIRDRPTNTNESFSIDVKNDINERTDERKVDLDNGTSGEIKRPVDEPLVATNKNLKIPLDTAYNDAVSGTKYTEDGNKQYTSQSLNDFGVPMILERPCEIEPSDSSELSDKNTSLTLLPAQPHSFVDDPTDIQRNKKFKKGVNPTKKGNLN